MKSSLKTISVIIGTIIGAGFASGKEIYIFFYQYGTSGTIGLILTTILFTIIIWKILDISIKNNIKKYNEIQLNSQISHIMNTFLLTSFYIMIAGFAAFIKQEYNIPIIIGAGAISLLSYITFKKGINGIVKANAILIPILIAILMHTCYKNVDNVLLNLQFTAIKNLEINNIKWLLRTLEYVGYNSIILIPILTSIKKEKKYNKWISLISGAIFFILSFGIIILLNKATKMQFELEIPILSIVQKYGKVYKYIFQFVIGISIYTTAISAGYGFIENTKNTNFVIIAITVSAVFIAYIGFTQLVEILYPIFGILGILQIYMIFKNCK